MTLVRNRPGVAFGPRVLICRSKIKLIWSGRPISRFSLITFSKNTRPEVGVSSICVNENSACRIDTS